jgi:hypothetical protein
MTMKLPAGLIKSGWWWQGSWQARIKHAITPLTHVQYNGQWWVRKCKRDTPQSFPMCNTMGRDLGPDTLRIILPRFSRCMMMRLVVEELPPLKKNKKKNTHTHAHTQQQYELTGVVTRPEHFSKNSVPSVGARVLHGVLSRCRRMDNTKCNISRGANTGGGHI